MDAEIPQLFKLGVVLEHVIITYIVPPERPLLPLAEPTALKKKFDNIFKATKLIIHFPCTKHNNG